MPELGSDADFDPEPNVPKDIPTSLQASCIGEAELDSSAREHIRVNLTKRDCRRYTMTMSVPVMMDG